MVRLAACAFVTGLFARVFGLMEFINPPPFGEIGEFSNSPTYDEGSTVNVAWTPGEEGGSVSLVLYQQNETDGMWFGDMEYLTQNAVDITRYSWLVGTRKNLTVSNLFYLSVFQEGKGASDSNSHYFYIEDNRAEETTSSSSSVLSSTLTPEDASTAAPTSTPTSSGSVIIPTSNITNVPNLSDHETSSDGFPVGAKIGLGLGIPVALILGLVGGWLIFNRHKKRDAALQYVTQELPADQTTHKYYYDGSYHGVNMNEAPPMSPVEIEEPHARDFSGWGSGSGNEVVTPPRPAPPVRYEM